MRQKIFLMILVVCLVVTTASGCHRTYDYSFSQSVDHVKKVEICQYDFDTRTTTSLVHLDSNQACALLSDIETLECKKHFGDHTEDYGEVVIYITYFDGTAEVIGLWNVALVDKEGLWHIGIEYFDANELCSIILKYVDEDLLPNLSEYQ